MLSDDQVAALGDGKRAFAVAVTVNGTTVPLRLARMGGENLIGLAKAARTTAGVEIGSSYEIEVVADTGERTVEVPDDLAAALAADPDAKTTFDAMAYSHRKEYVRWITEAKKADTRANRIAKAIEMIRAGQTR